MDLPIETTLIEFSVSVDSGELATSKKGKTYYNKQFWNGVTFGQLVWAGWKPGKVAFIVSLPHDKLESFTKSLTDHLKTVDSSVAFSRSLNNPTEDVKKGFTEIDAYRRAYDTQVVVLHSVMISNLKKKANTWIEVTKDTFHYESNRQEGRSPNWVPDFVFLANREDPNSKKVTGDIKLEIRQPGIIGDAVLATLPFNVNELLKKTTNSKEKTVVIEGRFGASDAYAITTVWKYELWKNCFSLQSSTPMEKQPELFLKGAHVAIMRQIENWVPILCNQIPRPTEPKGPQKTVEDLDGAFFVLEEDLDVPVPPEAILLIGLLNHLPFDDDNSEFPSRQAAMDYAKKFVEGHLNPPNEGNWENTTNDEATSRYFFFNNGSPFMKKTPTGYVGDLEWIHQFPVRPPYCTYGGKIYFDDKAKLLSIEYEGKTYYPPADGADATEWEFMKLLMRTSAFIAAAGVHLMQGHLKWSNYPNYAMRTAFEPDHPLRRLLHVHFWRSAMVAAKSLKSLVPKNGLLHRGTAFTIDGLHGLYKTLLKEFKFTTWPEELKARGLENSGDLYPGALDGMLYYRTIEQYLHNFIDIHYKSDSDVAKDSQLQEFWQLLSKQLQGIPPLTLATLKIVITEIVFRVTAWHQHIGNAIAACDDPTTISFRLLRNHLVTSLEGLNVQCLITCMTTMIMPKMSSTGFWEHMFANRPEEMEVYQNFTDEMSILTTKIVELNRKRPYRFVDFDPRYVCCSVSS